MISVRLVLPLVLMVIPPQGADPTAMPVRSAVETPKAMLSPAKSDSNNFGPARIDAYLRQQWKQEKIKPAPLCDDATFLRRVSLDITGALPPSDVAYAFIHDSRPAKRSLMIESLLSSRKYAEYWTDYWDALLIGRQTRAQVLDRAAFQAWLYRNFEKNTPWNQMVLNLISATGQNSPGDVPRIKAYGVSRMDKTKADDVFAADPNVNGAVNWVIKYGQMPQDLAGATSKTFLGVQIQCAQCHDHKTEKWTQADFRGFSSAYAHTKFDVLDKGPQIKGVHRLILSDAPRVTFPGGRMEELQQYVNAPPRALDGTSLGNDAGTRKALAAWITSPQNPWFAPSITNRMWAHFMGRGIQEPADDLPSDPTRFPPLLKSVSDDFASHNYDLKRLIRTICNTRTYQLAALKLGEDGGQMWSSHPLRPLRPEVLMDAIIQATNVDALLQLNAAERMDNIKAQIIRQFVFLFEVDEEHEQRSFEGTIPQALLLLNSRLTNDGSSVIPGDALAQVLHQPGDDATKIQNLYLRTLTREPNETELKRGLAYVQAPHPGEANTPEAKGAKDRDGMGSIVRLAMQSGAKDPKERAYEDLFWALLNASEFNLNH